MKYCHLSGSKHSNSLLNTFCSIMKDINRSMCIHSYELSFILPVVICSRSGLLPVALSDDGLLCPPTKFTTLSFTSMASSVNTGRRGGIGPNAGPINMSGYCLYTQHHLAALKAAAGY